MNTKQRLKNLRTLAPDYPRIPHFNNVISKMSCDDIILEKTISFPLSCYVQEKVDGANLGVTWTSGPVVRNRDHILRKGYEKKETPAKLQFRPVWNWAHAHQKDITKLSKSLMTPVTVYGEWMNFKHSIFYDKLPDIFLAYDIYLPIEDKFLAPNVFESEIADTSIKFIKSEYKTFNSINDIIKESETESKYRSGIVEGIVMKVSDDKYLTQSFKVVNKHFDRRTDFQEVIIKNKIKNGK